MSNVEGFARGKKVSETIVAGEESGQAGGEVPIATIKDAAGIILGVTRG